jgi:hypothetical protein
MDYPRLIRDAWAITWRSPFLWILGLLAGGSALVPSTAGNQSSDSGSQEFLASHFPLVAALAVLAMVLLLTFATLSMIARGGMARATTDLATGRASSLASAWRAGVHLFWRNVGLWLLLVVPALLVFAALGMVGVAAVGVGMLAHSPMAGLAIAAPTEALLVAACVWGGLRLARDTSAPRWLVVAAATLFALPVVTVLAAGAVMLSIVAQFAQRTMAVDDVGPVTAYRSAWQMTWAHMGESLVTWAINAGLAMAGEIATISGALGAIVALAAIGALVFEMAGLSVPLFAFAGAGGLLLIAGVLTLIGICNTFFWSYWTLVYLRLKRAPALGPAHLRRFSRRRCPRLGSAVLAPPLAC